MLLHLLRTLTSKDFHKGLKIVNKNEIYRKARADFNF